MAGPTFEWDDAKAKSNLVKHGVSFVAAMRVFGDPLRIERVDTRRGYGEERIQVIGQVGGEVLFVVYTERGTGYRMISARKATRNEREEYQARQS
ncbi:MAG: BrnT family toxin [Kiloniellaceae bacterium]